MGVERLRVMPRALAAVALVSILLFATTVTMAEIRVVDDSGQTIVLKAPARRIISLAPHATETLFYAGAGGQIVATVHHADFPEAAKGIPRVGDSSLLDMERIVSLKPDLIVVWLHGNSENQLDKLRTLGIPIFYSEPHVLADIPGSLVRFGKLAATEPAALQAASVFTTRLAEMRKRYSARPVVSLFYQVWKKPLLTINGGQIISDVIRLCGGKNIFADASLLVPTVDIEAVVTADPEAIIATHAETEGEDWFDVWRKWPGLRATANNNLILIDSDSISRNSPRILDGATLMCDALEAVRARRKP